MRTILTLTICITFLLSFNQNIYSQVGIGTTTPNATAVLDVTSTTQGLLAPRMSTAQRTGITTPAEGLLVFDTDLDAFYYYDTAGSTWRKLLTDINERDNYVLVKSEADFPAASGGIITLDENFLYEINGNIAMTNSINLNNATIIGHDIGEDMLTKATGNLFVGDKGGEIKNITVVATGGSVFNLDDTANNQELIVIAIDIFNSASVGTIKGYSLATFSNCEYKGNTTGVTFDNIKDLVLSNQEWLDTNSGTYETFIGTFEIIEKEGGFSDVNTGVTAIDVSTNTTVNRGVMLGSIFEGAGTYVNGYTVGSYTGYFFDNNWFVDCPGLSVETDSNAVGFYYMTGNTTNTNFVTDNVPVKVGGTTLTISGSLFRMSSATPNRLVYEGKEAREFQVICTGALDHGTTSTPNGRTYVFYLSKIPNGGSPAIVPSITSGRRFSNNDVGNFSMVGLINLDPGDAIEIWVSINRADNVDTDFTRLNVVLK